MIVFDLSCADGHRFEGWFGSSSEFARQQENGLVACPSCGSHAISKAPMAPAVPRKGEATRPPRGASRNRVDQHPGGGQMTGPEADSNGVMPPRVLQALARLAEVQNEALRRSRWVGRNFADTSRAMHYGERAVEPIHGRASPEEARSLLEEGISIAPLPFPIAPPDEVN